MPYYNRDPKRDPNFDNHPYTPSPEPLTKSQERPAGKSGILLSVPHTSTLRQAAGSRIQGRTLVWGLPKRRVGISTQLSESGSRSRHKDPSFGIT